MAGNQNQGGKSQGETVAAAAAAASNPPASGNEEAERLRAENEQLRRQLADRDSRDQAAERDRIERERVGRAGGGGTARTSEERRPARPIPPFTVELGDDCNRTITVDTLKLRLRGKYKTPRGAGVVMDRMPDIPGMRLTIDAQARRVRIFDPLEDDEGKLNVINSVLSEATAVGGGKHGVVKAVVRDLTADETKSLLLEVVQLIRDKSAELVDGSLPSREAIDSQPGHQLHDPWNSSRHKPKYEKDAEDYYDKLERESVRG